MKAASYATKLNANAASAKRSQAQSAATFQAALEYRRQQQALAETAAVSAAAAEAASEAAALEAAAEGVHAESDDAPSVVAKRDAEDAGINGLAKPVNNSGHTLRAVVRLNGSGKDAQLKGLSGTAAQHAQQAPALTDGSPRVEQEAVRLHVASAAPKVAQNGAQNGGRHNGIAQLGQTPGVAAGNAVVSGSRGDNAASETGQTGNGSLPPQTEAKSQRMAEIARTGNDAVTDSAAARSAPGSSPSSSAANSDAMTAALASIKSKQGDAKPQELVHGKAVPAPLPGTSPRVKSALLAAQEYRKQKAAKTAAAALAAARAAAAASQCNEAA